jgi:uncharacterized protein YcnI
MKKRRTLSAAVPLAAGAGLLLALAAPLAASAHVTVSPNTASAGSYALVTLKVPNESATAVTDRLELELPTDTPFSSVSYVPVSGWDAELVRETLPEPVTVGGNEVTEAVTSIVWTAQPGFEVASGQLQLFPVSLGPVPEVDKIVFVAHQGYSDGTVVSWSDTEEGAEHPAPTLYVNAAPASDHHGAGDAGGHEGDDPTAGDGEQSDTADDAAGASASTDAVARGIGIGGLVVGAVGIAIAAVALRRKSVR